MKRFGMKLTSIILSLALLMPCLPLAFLSVSAVSDAIRVADEHTLDQWKEYFGVQTKAELEYVLSTEFAGGVWTDKSVFEADQIPDQLKKDAVYVDSDRREHTISIQDKGDNFLVALSAIASNKQIKGYSTIPTDTVLILDLSSSMRSTDDNRGSAVDELVEATNKAISDLLSLNANNRVAVVVYAGNTDKEFTNAGGITQIVLPLDSYTTTTAGQYLASVSVGNNANYALEVRSGVKNSSGQSVSKNRFETARGTYMQDGIYEAMKVLLAADPTVQSGVQVGTKRIPIMVLMTDGEPTMANNDYNGNDNRTDLGTSNLYNYEGSTGQYRHRDTIAFLTSLTAAFAKKEIGSHYDNIPLMYTLPYGNSVFNRAEALSILNPVDASDVQNELWNEFLNGQSINVYRSGSGGWNPNYSYLTTQNSSVPAEKLTSQDRYYVDRYFPAQSDEEMLSAFESIVAEIILQSKYYPTYVEKDTNHDGYLTFADKIGQFMEVTDVAGIVVGERLFSGQALAEKFPVGHTDSIIAENALGKDLVNSVKQRIGITNDAVATALVQDAYDHKQLYYDKTTGEFQHYIGWFAKEIENSADGESKFEYVDFFHKGMTAEQIAAAKAKGATHVVRSYGFLGDTTVVPGVANTDMMYMSVRIATSLDTLDTIVVWKIPASLVPTLTYEAEVEVNANGQIIKLDSLELEQGTANAPIRLLYEVALRGDLKDWNLENLYETDPSFKSYVDQNGYTFYSNKWDTDPEDTTQNTYSHFEPSIQNERYYYTYDTPVLQKTGTDTYAEYTGATKPIGTGFYHAIQVFEKLKNGSYRVHYHYESISSEALDEAVKEGNGWIIPKDTVHRYYDFEISPKEDPMKTQTMGYTDHPFVVKDGNVYYTYSTQGNNGKLTVTPATGIRLTKTLAQGYENSGEFTFVISGNTSGARVVRLTDSGAEAGREDLLYGGKVKIKGGETVYIIGLSAGTYHVAEEIPAGATFAVQSVYVNGSPVNGKEADVTVTSQSISALEFVNNEQLFGSLIVSKDVEHPFTQVPDALTNKAFTISVDLEGENVGGKAFTASGHSTITQVTTDADGKFEVSLKDGEFVTVSGIPVGTTYTVTEQIPSTDQGFSLDQANSTLNGTISASEVSFGRVINKYAPEKADTALVITGTKTVDDRAGAFQWAGRSFSFKLEQYDPSTGMYTQVGQTQTVTTNGGSYTFGPLTFDTLGTYYYKVSEIIPESADRIDGMSYDATTGRLEVRVTDHDLDGEMEAEVVNFDTGLTLAPQNNTVIFEKNFENVYTTSATSVEFTATKLIEDSHNTGISRAGFLFGLYKVEGGAVAAQPSFTVRSVGSAGKATFHIPLNAVTEDHYVLKEIVPANQDKIPGMEYDETTQYDVVVKAEADVNSKLVGSVQISKDGQPVSGDQISFTNKMVLNPATALWTVNKIEEGSPDTSEAYKFTLTETDGSFVTKLPGGVTEEITITGSGQKQFDSISYTALGTHYYVVKEVSGTKLGMTYDKAEYHITVNVTQNGNDLVANTVISKLGVGIVPDIRFTNTYTITGNTTVQISGEKTLTGRPMVASEFAFHLEEVADQTGAPKANPLVRRTENLASADGEKAAFRFDPITFTQRGTYYYKITELSGPSGNGVTYSTDFFIVEVQVKDNDRGGLTSSWRVVDDRALQFKNTYAPENVKVDFHAHKELDGKLLSPGRFEFTFELIQTESDFETEHLSGEKRTVNNDPSGYIDFGDFTYRGEGVCYYLIREKIPANPLPGIVYDKTEYHVSVVVTDNHKGQLLADTTIVAVVEEDGVKKTMPASSIDFYNQYVLEDGKVQFTVEKKMTGDSTDPSGFLFELREKGEDTPIETVESPENGLISFGAITFTQPGTYFYTISEKNTGKTGVTYDEKVYEIEVTVSDNDEGKLVVSYKVNGKDVDEMNYRFVFRNQFTKPTPPTTTTTPTVTTKPQDPPASSEAPAIPQTGDGSLVTLWFALLFISGGGMIISTTRRRKENQAQ